MRTCRTQWIDSLGLRSGQDQLPAAQVIIVGGLDDDHDAQPADPTDKERIDVAVAKMLAGETSSWRVRCEFSGAVVLGRGHGEADVRDGRGCGGRNVNNQVAR